MELLRGSVVLGGYPWYFLAHPLVEWMALAQSADLFGSYFISFLAAMTGGALVDIALRMKSRPRTRWSVWRPAAIVVAVLTINGVYGVWRMSQGDSLSPGPSILAVQTNLPQSNKVAWSPQQQIDDFISFFQQTVAALKEATAGGDRVDLIVWPETMLPGFGLEPDTLKFLAEGGYSPGDAFARGIETLRETVQVPLLIGSPTYLGLRVESGEWAWDTQYNSAYLVQDSPPFQRYDKAVLTPFGETMPLISNWKWLEQKMLSFGARGMKFELSSNPDMKLLTLQIDAPADAPKSTAFTLGVPICFEDTVAPWCRRMVYDGGAPKRADVLVNLSNDGWFGEFDSERVLQAKIARYRCIENRVPMVRVVNTGTSVAIDSAGRVIGRIGEGRYGMSRIPGSLLAKTQIDARRTLFGRIGGVWPWSCLVASALGLLLTLRRVPQSATN
jgi:apolipoprotein N-acyltransferase